MDAAPEELDQQVALTFIRTFGKARDIPSDFFPHALFKKVRHNLGARIPNAHPHGRTEWLNVVNAVDSIFAVERMLRAYDSSTSHLVHDKILKEALPAICKWLVYMDPRNHYCEEDEHRAAMASYGWPILDAQGQCWMYDAICKFIISVNLIPGGMEALVCAYPGPVASYMFDVWWLRVERIADNECADVPTTTFVGYLTNYILTFGTNDQRLLFEILGKGMPAVRMIIRRLRALTTMPVLDFDEAIDLVSLALALAKVNCARPLLRPLLWLAVPLSRLVCHPSSIQYGAQINPLDGETCECFLETYYKSPSV